MGDLDKLIAAKGFKKLPKVQNIAQSGNTGCDSVCRTVASFARDLKFKSNQCIFYQLFWNCIDIMQIIFGISVK